MAGKKNRQKRYKRADHPEQKDERRQLILRAAAEELMSVVSVEDFTIDALAQRAGLAKGTVYLYFKSKSAILIELLGDAVEDLATDIGAKFSKLPEPVNARQAAVAIRDCLKRGAIKRRLAQLAKSLSDKNSASSQQNYRKRVEPFLEQVDAVIVGRLHGLLPGEGRMLIRYGWALLLGLSEIAEQQPRASAVPVNVEQSLTESLTLLIGGYFARSR